MLEVFIGILCFFSGIAFGTVFSKSGITLNFKHSHIYEDQPGYINLEQQLTEEEKAAISTPKTEELYKDADQLSAWVANFIADPTGAMSDIDKKGD